MREVLLVSPLRPNSGTNDDSQCSKFWIAIQYEKPYQLDFQPSELFVRRIEDSKYYAVKKELTSSINSNNLEDFKNEISDEVFQKIKSYLFESKLPFDDIITNESQESIVNDKINGNFESKTQNGILQSNLINDCEIINETTKEKPKNAENTENSIDESDQTNSLSSTSLHTEINDNEESDKFLAQILNYSEVINSKFDINDFKFTRLSLDSTQIVCEINLYHINNIVNRLGGEKKVTKNNLWFQVFEEMDICKTNDNISMAIKLYSELLNPFNKYMKTLGQNFLNVSFSPKISSQKNKQIKKKIPKKTNLTHKSKISSKNLSLNDENSYLNDFDKSQDSFASSYIDHNNKNRSKKEKLPNSDKHTISLSNSNKKSSKMTQSKIPKNETSNIITETNNSNHLLTKKYANDDSNNDFDYLLDLNSVFYPSHDQNNNDLSSNTNPIQSLPSSFIEVGENPAIVEEMQIICKKKGQIYARMLECAKIHQNLKDELKLKEKQLQN